MRAWREARCATACPDCLRCCCEGRLNPRLDRLDRFSDLPVVRAVTDPRPLHGPYVADRRFWRWGACYLVGRCPHLDAQRRCAIHGQPGRPAECDAYPLHLQRVPGGMVLHAELSCPIFQSEEALTDVHALAVRLGVELRVEPACD